MHIAWLMIISLCAGLQTSPDQDPGPPPPPEVALDVSPQRIKEHVTKLASFGTRHSLSDVDEQPSRGIAAARAWLVELLESTVAGANARVEVVAFTAGEDHGAVAGASLHNIVVTIPGTVAEKADYVVAVLANYDSVNADIRDSEGDAPGANLNASGVAGVLELVNWFVQHPTETTLVMALTDAGEHGGVGAKAFAEMGKQRQWNVLGAFVLSAIGDPRGTEGRFNATRFRIFSDSQTSSVPGFLSDAVSNGPSRELARYIQMIAQTQQEVVDPWVVSRPARIGAHGEHLVLNQAGIPAVEVTQLWDNYDRQRVNVSQLRDRLYGDVPEFVDEDYIAGITRLIGLSIEMLANAPLPPKRVGLDASQPMYHTALEWSKSPSSDAAGYEIAIRSVDDRDWIAAVDAGQLTRMTLERHRDSWVFAVRAYDEHGNRSLPTYAVFETSNQ